MQQRIAVKRDRRATAGLIDIPYGYNKPYYIRWLSFAQSMTAALQCRGPRYVPHPTPYTVRDPHASRENRKKKRKHDFSLHGLGTTKLFLKTTTETKLYTLSVNTRYGDLKIQTVNELAQLRRTKDSTVIPLTLFHMAYGMLSDTCINILN